MTNTSGEKRVDSGSRVIKASPHTIYQAFLDPKSAVAWRPPEGMRGEIYEFEPHQGGKFRMAFIYTGPDHPAQGKTSEHADMFQGRFEELVPDERIVELVKFESADPAYEDAMKLTTTLTPVPGGTEVTVIIENVPGGISPSDHQAGIDSSLKNLAAFTE